MIDLADLPLKFPGGPQKKRRRQGRPRPAPRRSSRMYLYAPPDKIHLFRYLLEAEDHLGVMTVVDRRRAALLVRFSPHREQDLPAFLDRARQLLALEGPLPVGETPAS